MKYVKITVVALLLILLTALVAQNGEPVETRLLFWTVSLPQAAFLMGSAVVGFLIGLVTMLMLRHKPKAKYKPEKPSRSSGEELP